MESENNLERETPSDESGEQGFTDSGPEERRKEFLRERGLPEDEEFYHPASPEPDDVPGVAPPEPSATPEEE